MPPIRNKKKKRNATIKIIGKDELANILELEANDADEDKTIIMGELANIDYPDVFKLNHVSVSNLGYKEIVQTNYAHCKLCAELLFWSGGNVGRHYKRCPMRKGNQIDLSISSDPSQSKVTDFVVKQLNTSQIAELTNEIVKFCVNTAQSFNHMSDDNFKELIAGVVHLINTQYQISDVKSRLPDRQTISRKCQLAAERLVQAMYEKIKPLFDEQRVTLAIDFGKHHGVDFLSVCASYLDDEAEWKLRVVPLAFLPCLSETKDHEEVYNMLERLAEKIGITPETFRMSYICADGGSNLKKCAETKFKGYIKCANHGIHKVAERTVEWYKAEEDQYSEEERRILHSLSQLISDCRNLSLLIRGTNEIRKSLTVLPNSGAPTRWLSFLSCVEDILPLLPKCTVYEETKGLAAKLLSNQKKLSSILFVLKSLKDWNLVFQTEDVSIHLVAPLYRTLIQEFENQRNGTLIPKNENSFDLDVIRLLGKSASLAAYRQYSELDDVHYVATFLNPGTKNENV